MKPIRLALRHLDSSQKMQVVWSTVVRFLLVGLDLIGVMLIGVAAAVAAGTGTEASSATGQIISAIEKYNLGNAYVVIAVCSLIFFLAKGVLSIFLNSHVANFFSNLEATKSTELFERIVSGDLDRRERWNSKEIVHGLIPGMQTAFGSSLIHGSAFLGEIFMIGAIAAFLALKNFWLFLITCAFFGLVAAVLNRFVSKKSTEIGSAHTRNSISLSLYTENVFAGIKTVRSLADLQTFFDFYRSLRQQISKNSAEMVKVSILPRYVTEIALMIAAGALIAQRSILGNEGIPADTVAVFFAGALRIVASLLTLQGSISAIKHAEGVTKITFDLFTSYEDGDELSRVNSYNEENMVQSDIGLQVQNVSYTYPSASKLVLDSMSFELRRGEFMAVMGESGAGKSTLSDLILGLRQSQAGQILYDGVQVTKYLRQNPSRIGYLSQDPPIFMATIAENVSMEFDPTLIDRSRVEWSLRMAHLEGFVNNKLKGIDEIVDKDRNALSGGEAQRLGLARIFYHEPELIVLDEPSSALDFESELKIKQAIDGIKDKTAIILISHTTRLFSEATRFAKIENGRFVEFPNLDELLNSNKI